MDEPSSDQWIGQNDLSLILVWLSVGLLFSNDQHEPAMV